MWTETLQRKIVKESHIYGDWVDPGTGIRKGGENNEGRITLAKFKRFTGICVLMAVRNQPSLRDFWSVQDEALRCDEVASTMSRNRFLYILKVLHFVPKASLVHEKTDPRYDPIGQVRWMMNHMVYTFQSLWNSSPYLCVDEIMVTYNGKFCSFKQYLPLKPVTHGIKIWCLACSVTKFVLNLEVYIGAANESLQGLPTHSCGSGAGFVSRVTTGWEGN